MGCANLIALMRTTETSRRLTEIGNRHLLILGGLALLTTLCGYIGFSAQFHQRRELKRTALVGVTPETALSVSRAVASPDPDLREPGWVDRLTWVMDAFLANSLSSRDMVSPLNGWLFVCRLSGIGFALFSGFVVFQAAIGRWWLFFRSQYWTGHVVVVGLGRKGRDLVEHLRCYGPAEGLVVVAAAVTDDEHAYCTENRIPLVESHGEDGAVLRRIHAERARFVFLITGVDARNLAIEEELVRLRESRQVRTRADLFVHLDNPKLLGSVAVHRRGRISTNPDLVQLEDERDRRVGYHFFDLFEAEARRVLADIAALSVPGDAVRQLVILGFGRMGRALAWAALDLEGPFQGERVRVTVIDRNALGQRSRFLFRHPLADSGTDGGAEKRLQFVNQEAETIETYRLMEGMLSRAAVVPSNPGEPPVTVHGLISVDDNARASELAYRWSGLFVRVQDSLWMRRHVFESEAPAPTGELLAQGVVPRNVKLFGELLPAVRGVGKRARELAAQS